MKKIDRADMHMNKKEYTRIYNEGVEGALTNKNNPYEKDYLFNFLWQKGYNYQKLKKELEDLINKGVKENSNFSQKSEK